MSGQLWLTSAAALLLLALGLQPDQLPGATAAPVIKLPAARTAGYPGHALYFDGALTGAKSVVNLDLPATGPTSEFTVSAWIRIARHKQHNMLMVSHERSVGFALFVDSGEKLCLGLFRPEGMKTVSSRSMQLPFAWHHVVGTYDGNQSLVYVDGVPGDADHVPGLVFPRLAFTAGGAPGIPGMRMEGTLARVQVWNHARSAAQVAADMLADWAAPQKHQPGLLGSWGMSEGMGLVMADKSAAARAAQISGDFVNLPKWVRATIPHFATGQNEAVIKLGSEISEGKLEVVNQPPGGRLYLQDSTTGAPAGPLPQVPWPLVSGRQLRFVPDEGVFAEAEAAQRPVCTSFLLRFTDKAGASTSHVVEVLVGTTAAHRRQHNLNQGCRQARAFQGVTSVAAGAKLPRTPTVSFLMPLVAGGDSWASALESVLRQDGAALPCEVVVTHPPKNVAGVQAAVTELQRMAADAGGKVGFHEMPEGFTTTAQLVNQAGLLARGKWLLPMRPAMRLSPGYLLEVASALASRDTASLPSVIAPSRVDGDTGMPLVCPMEGTLPTHPSSDGEDTDLVDINTGAAATCGCGEPDADALASLAAAALGLNDLWPLLLPGALVPATTFNTAGGWDESAPLELYHWDFWLRALDGPTAGKPSILRAGAITVASHDGLQPGQCGWDDRHAGWGGHVEGAPLLDSVVALLRLRHRRRFGAESLAEAASLVARMAPGILPVVDCEVEVEPEMPEMGLGNLSGTATDVAAAEADIRLAATLGAAAKQGEPNISVLSK